MTILSNILFNLIRYLYHPIARSKIEIMFNSLPKLEKEEGLLFLS
jgi:hypothetical protein